MYAGVYILDAVYHIDKIYDYYISDEMYAKNNVNIGCFVIVPFGGGNRKRTAIIWNIKNDTEIQKTKPISEIIESGVSLDNEQMKLAEFIKDTTFCTIGEAVKTILPAGLRQDIFYLYKLNSEIELNSAIENLNQKNIIVLSFIAEKARMLKELESEFGEDIKYVLKNLQQLGYIIEETSLSRLKKEKTEKFISLNEKYTDYQVLSETVKNITPQALSVVEYLQYNGESSIDDITDYLEITDSAVKTLHKKGIIDIFDRHVDRDMYNSLLSDEEKALNLACELNETQNNAYEKLLNMYKNKRPCAALLHGVTGSGKTHVLLKLISDVINSSKTVIYLVPEISLIPQIYSFLESIYGGTVKILHSSLSKGGKLDTWDKILKEQVNIIVGTRSAIFAPLKNLGLVVVDEEHEHTYKSEQKPHYHARDIARFKCAFNNSMMILSSATPLIESYYKTKDKYELVKLEHRFGVSTLPVTEIVDMKFEDPENKIKSISKRLTDEIADTLNRKEQIIVYQNRRGYNNFLSCRACGEVVMCPRCSIALKLHAEEKRQYTDRSRRQPSKLTCHYCGFTALIPEKCPSCDSEHLLAFGTGTQKCEDDVSEMFPNARIARMDADTTTRKNSHENIIKSVKNNEVDILIGTQMVTKGHNFQNVTLVGVLNADQTLYMEDYRSGEKTFSMISQVTGRAGRSVKEGKAIIQTINPENEILRIAVDNDYEKLYEKEIRFRKAAMFPPFCDICVLNISSNDEAQSEAVAKQVSFEIKNMLSAEFNDVAVEMYGPFQAIIYKINNNFRFRFIIKCKLNKRARLLFSTLLESISKKIPPKLTINIDINPNII